MKKIYLFIAILFAQTMTFAQEEYKKDMNLSKQK